LSAIDPSLWNCLNYLLRFCEGITNVKGQERYTPPPFLPFCLDHKAWTLTLFFSSWAIFVFACFRPSWHLCLRVEIGGKRWVFFCFGFFVGVFFSRSGHCGQLYLFCLQGVGARLRYITWTFSLRWGGGKKGGVSPQKSNSPYHSSEGLGPLFRFPLFFDCRRCSPFCQCFF